MQASNIIDARPPEHSGRGGWGLASDGIELAECGKGCMCQVEDIHNQSIEFRIGHERWNQMEVDVLCDNALDIMEARVGWNSMLQEPFFFFSRDRFTLDQSKQCLEGFRCSMSSRQWCISCLLYRL